MDRALHRGFAVGDYKVAPTERRVYGPGGSRHLCGQTIQLLELLAEHAGELIEREQIIRQLGQGRHNPRRVLTRCVSELRRCLGDDSAHPRYIETVPGHGYRLIAAVRPTGFARTISQPIPHEDHPRSRWSVFLLEVRQRNVCRAALLYTVVIWLLYQVAEIVIPALQLPDWTLTLVVLLGIFGFPLVVVLAWALELTPDGLVIDLPRSERSSIGHSSRTELVLTAGMLVFAVLISVQLAWASLGFDDVEATPRNDVTTIRALAVGSFVAAGAGPESDALGRALVEELRHLLRDSQGFQVLAAPATNPTKRQDLAADALLEGSVNVDSSGVRVIVHLVDPRTGYDIWSLALDEPNGSLSSVQVRLAKRIAAELPVSSPESTTGLLASALHGSGERLAEVGRQSAND